MSFTSNEGRQQLLAAVAEATDELAAALAAVGTAYELLPDPSADALEEQLFAPLQAAYGRAQRAHNDFAARHGLDTRSFDGQEPRAPSTGAQGLIEDAVASVERADETLATLQDSLLPVEVGDAEIRARLAEIRELLGVIPQRAQALLRTLGR